MSVRHSALQDGVQCARGRDRAPCPSLYGSCSSVSGWLSHSGQPESRVERDTASSATSSSACSSSQRQSSLHTSWRTDRLPWYSLHGQVTARRTEMSVHRSRAHGARSGIAGWHPAGLTRWGRLATTMPTASCRRLGRVAGRCVARCEIAVGLDGFLRPTKAAVWVFGIDVVRPPARFAYVCRTRDLISRKGSRHERKHRTPEPGQQRKDRAPERRGPYGSWQGGAGADAAVQPHGVGAGG